MLTGQLTVDSLVVNGETVTFFYQVAYIPGTGVSYTAEWMQATPNSEMLLQINVWPGTVYNIKRGLYGKVFKFTSPQTETPFTLPSVLGSP